MFPGGGRLTPCSTVHCGATPAVRGPLGDLSAKGSHRLCHLARSAAALIAASQSASTDDRFGHGVTPDQLVFILVVLRFDVVSERRMPHEREFAVVTSAMEWCNLPWPSSRA